jgi:hypothetical protein
MWHAIPNRASLTTSPDWFSMIEWQFGIPTPIPLGLLEKLGLKCRFKFSGPIPLFDLKLER